MCHRRAGITSQPFYTAPEGLCRQSVAEAFEAFEALLQVGHAGRVTDADVIVRAERDARHRRDLLRDLLVMQEELRAVADELIVVTDDGSAGRKALVTEPLKELCAVGGAGAAGAAGASKPDIVVAIGPPIMMKFCAETTRPFGVKTLVSLNTIMIDGTGMCGGCRVSVGGETKFVCVDGPEFDGHLVDWDG